MGSGKVGQSTRGVSPSADGLARQGWPKACVRKYIVSTEVGQIHSIYKTYV